MRWKSAITAVRDCPGRGVYAHPTRLANTGRSACSATGLECNAGSVVSAPRTRSARRRLSTAQASVGVEPDHLEQAQRIGRRCQARLEAVVEGHGWPVAAVVESFSEVHQPCGAGQLGRLAEREVMRRHGANGAPA